MVKTQIQIPEKQYRELRKFSEEREWSMAETLRRGAELLMQVYPSHVADAPKPWTPPSSDDVGWQGLDSEGLKEAVFKDLESEMS